MLVGHRVQAHLHGYLLVISEALRLKDNPIMGYELLCNPSSLHDVTSSWFDGAIILDAYLDSKALKNAWLAYP